MAAKKILILVGDFVEDYDVMVPFMILQVAGHTAHAACPGKKAGERIKTALHDFEGDQTYTEKMGHFFTLNATFDDVKAEDYDAYVVPGGRAPEYLRVIPAVIALTKAFANAKKPMAALCHGIQVFTAADVVKGRGCTSYSALEPEVRASGGKWVAMADDRAHVDGNFVTGTAWPAIPEWMRLFLEVLGTKIEP